MKSGGKKSKVKRKNWTREIDTSMTKRPGIKSCLISLKGVFSHVTYRLSANQYHFGFDFCYYFKRFKLKTFSVFMSLEYLCPAFFLICVVCVICVVCLWLDLIGVCVWWKDLKPPNNPLWNFVIFASESLHRKQRKGRMF